MNSQSQLKGMWWWTVVWLKMSRTFSERVWHDSAITRDRGTNMQRCNSNIYIAPSFHFQWTSLKSREESIWTSELNRLFDSPTPFTFWVVPGNVQHKHCSQFQAVLLRPIAHTEHGSSLFVQLCISWCMACWIHFPSCQMELVIMWCYTQIAYCPALRWDFKNTCC